MANVSLFAAALVVLGLVPIATATASGPQSHACAGVSPPSERLACYDAAFPPLSDPQALAQAKEKAVAEFGLSDDQLRERDPARARDLEPSRIEATVSVLGQRADGARVVTLDNGQVWVLTTVTSKGPLNVGDRVTVRAAALGTYMLVTPGGVPLRVRRMD